MNRTFWNIYGLRNNSDRRVSFISKVDDNTLAGCFYYCRYVHTANNAKNSLLFLVFLSKSVPL